MARGTRGGRRASEATRAGPGGQRVTGMPGSPAGPGGRRAMVTPGPVRAGEEETCWG